MVLFDVYCANFVFFCCCYGVSFLEDSGVGLGEGGYNRNVGLLGLDK